jgi:hypothetical protein
MQNLALPALLARLEAFRPLRKEKAWLRAWTCACRVRLRRTNRENEEPEGSKEKLFILFSSAFFPAFFGGALSLTSFEQSEAHLFSSFSNSDLERLSSGGTQLYSCVSHVCVWSFLRGLLNSWHHTLAGKHCGDSCNAACRCVRARLCFNFSSCLSAQTRLPHTTGILLVLCHMPCCS